MQARLATSISIVFHPIFMPTLAFIVLFFMAYQLTGLTDEGKFHLLGLIFFSTCIVPAISVFMLYKSKLISSLHIADRKERILPFTFITLFFVIITYMMSRKMGVVSVISSLMMGITSIMCLLTLITLFYKVSMHACGISSVLGFLVGLQYQSSSLDLMYPVLVFIILVGLVLSARLKLKAHTLDQLVVGTLLGFGTCFTLMLNVF
jgi:hypothetical protein